MPPGLPQLQTVFAGVVVSTHVESPPGVRVSGRVRPDNLLLDSANQADRPHFRGHTKAIAPVSGPRHLRKRNRARRSQSRGVRTQHTAIFAGISQLSVVRTSRATGRGETKASKLMTSAFRACCRESPAFTCTGSPCAWPRPPRGPSSPSCKGSCCRQMGERSVFGPSSASAFFVFLSDG